MPGALGRGLRAWPWPSGCWRTGVWRCACTAAEFKGRRELPQQQLTSLTVPYRLPSKQGASESPFSLFNHMSRRQTHKCPGRL